MDKMPDPSTATVSDLEEKLGGMSLESSTKKSNGLDLRRRDRSKEEDEEEHDHEHEAEEEHLSRSSSQQNEAYGEPGEGEGDVIDIEIEGTANDDDVVPGERERGDGEEVPHQSASRSEEAGENENRKNPAFVPKRGNFYQHDMRGAANEDENEKIAKQSKKLQFIESQSKWKHDMFYEEEQAPKSRQELIDMYGYDIRNEGKAPMGNRVRKYGRSKKQPHDWRDADSYLPRRRRGGGSSARGRPTPSSDDRFHESPSGGQRRDFSNSAIRTDDYDEYPPLRNDSQTPWSVNATRVNQRVANNGDSERYNVETKRARSFEELQSSMYPRNRREQEEQWQRRGSYRPRGSGFVRRTDGFRPTRSRGSSRYGGNRDSDYYNNSNYYNNRNYYDQPPESSRPVPVMEFRRRAEARSGSFDDNSNYVDKKFSPKEKSNSSADNREHPTPKGGNVNSGSVLQPYELPPRFQQHKDTKRGPYRAQQPPSDLNDSIASGRTNESYEEDVEELADEAADDQRTSVPQNLQTGGRSTASKRYSALRQHQVVTVAPTTRPAQQQQQQQQPQKSAVSPPQAALPAGVPTGGGQLQPHPSMVHGMVPPPPQKVLHAYVSQVGPMPIPFAPAYFDGYSQAGPQTVYTGDVTQTQFVPPPPGFSAPPEAFCMPRVNPGVPPQAFVAPVTPAGFHPAMLPPQYNVPQANEGQPQQVYSPHVTYYNTESQQAAPRPAPKARPKSVIPIVSPESGTAVPLDESTAVPQSRPLSSAIEEESVEAYKPNESAGSVENPTEG